MDAWVLFFSKYIVFLKCSFLLDSIKGAQGHVYVDMNKFNNNNVWAYRRERCFCRRCRLSGVYL